jgi:hypothetical protein
MRRNTLRQSVLSAIRETAIAIVSSATDAVYSLRTVATNAPHVRIAANVSNARRVVATGAAARRIGAAIVSAAPIAASAPTVMVADPALRMMTGIAAIVNVANHAAIVSAARRAIANGAGKLATGAVTVSDANHAAIAMRKVKRGVVGLHSIRANRTTIAVKRARGIRPHATFLVS